MAKVVARWVTRHGCAARSSKYFDRANPTYNCTDQSRNRCICPAVRDGTVVTHTVTANRPFVTAVIPCLDEAEAIGDVVRAVLANGAGEVIVVDGGSTDATVERARAAGARVEIERRRGYGRAMQCGLAALRPDTGIVLFLDGDGSDRPERIPDVLAPLHAGTADFVMGSRLKGERENGSLSPAQILAGHLAGALIWLFYGVRFTDMSPFRAIARDKLETLGMTDDTYGWSLEMQMRVAAKGLRIVELPVGQRRRVGGVSKVSGDLRMAFKVAWILARTFVRLALRLRAEPRAQRL